MNILNVSTEPTNEVTSCYKYLTNKDHAREYSEANYSGQLTARTRASLSSTMWRPLTSLSLLGVLSVTEAIRVLQTNPNIELPPRLAQAELLDSSLNNLETFTICMREGFI